eukprot:CAMPEP_0184673296 /NCGR_PEP_ID=MMETSP0308-20130426/86600_1 /TAXON_ID=38269 /ORGANISM="Gloeochaete witrockiana, Strain SAG 46.84" /LENGTH=322 /DNA_ID=CAMNT_0027120765 /DNA_START=29 /DNA_END=997 /DNA_ORIENTATION=+
MVKISEFFAPEAYVNVLAVLVIDRNPSIRKEFFSTLFYWLSILDDKTEHEGRLLPYLLTGLTDECEEIQRQTFDWMETLGELYEKEHEDDLKEVKEYLGDMPVQHPDPLPPQFPRRPRMGARILVRKECGTHGGFLKALLAELSSWTSTPKVHAVQLLEVALVYAEEYVTQHTNAILSALCSACADKEISSKIFSCARLVGRFINPDVYLRLLLPALTDEQSTLAQGDKVCQMQVLSAILSGSNADRLLPHFPKVLYALRHTDIAQCSDYTLRAEAETALVSLVAACSRTEEGADEINKRYRSELADIPSMEQWLADHPYTQ